MNPRAASGHVITPPTVSALVTVLQVLVTRTVVRPLVTRRVTQLAAHPVGPGADSAIQRITTVADGGLLEGIANYPRARYVRGRVRTSSVRLAHPSA